MALTLTSLLNSTSSSGSAADAFNSNAQSASAAAAKLAAASPLGGIQKRVQADADSTKAQLSAFGVLKSAVAQSQTSAQAASTLNATASVADVTKAMADFFNSYNATIAASQATTRSTTGGAVDQGNPGRVSKDFQWALSGPSASDAMKKLGLSIKADGTLAQDARKFADALKADPTGIRSALVKLGAGLAGTASKELDATGAVGGTLNRLAQRSTALQAQQKALTTAAQGLAAYKANS